MRIGELAAQAGISTKAIRYYKRIGVLAFAATVRPPTWPTASLGTPHWA
jgi:hypothetical protein